jgi:hypothetical protein
MPARKPSPSHTHRLDRVRTFIQELDSMRTVHATLLTLGLAAMVVGPAAAQGPGRGFSARMGNYSGLLDNESVQKEIKLDDKQVEKAKELAEKVNEKMRDARESLQSLEGEERATKQREINREITAMATKEMSEFLKPAQVARFKQISYQQQGAQALMSPDVAEKLNLTEAQKNEIREIQTESQQEMRTVFQDFQNDREGAMKKMNELRAQTLAKVEAKFNDEQKKTWKELLGAPFEVKFEPRPQ